MQARLAPGHDPMGNVVPNWDLPTLAGAGALRSTTNDMLTFLAANLDSTGKPLGAVLHRTHAALRPTTIPNMQIGLNWHIASRNGSTVVWHNGGTGGYRTFIGLDQSRRLAVVVLTNSGGAGGDDIGFHILVPSSPLATLPPAPKARTAITLDTTMLDHYLGAYELAPGVILTVTRDGSQLFVQLTGQEKIAAFAESEGEFFLKIVDAQLSFVKDSTGAIGSAVLHQNGANQTMKRMNK
jgi:D-alanyl-D-alanine-carboxypeptidase/D-alanyl-D-alanine-endopeptidase